MENELNINEIIDRQSKTLETYKDLLIQRDNCKSNVLKDLLNKELSYYVSLSETAGQCLTMLSKRIGKSTEDDSNFLNNQLNAIKNIDDPKIALQLTEDLENKYSLLCALNDFDIQTMKLIIKNYDYVASRNFKDWGKFLKLICEQLADLTLDSIPFISEFKNLYDGVKNVAEIMNEFETNGTDYSGIDNAIFIIEKHIEIMKITILGFMDTIDILKTNED